MQETKHTTDAEGKYSFTIPPEQTSKRYLYIELDVEHPNYAPQAHFGYALGMIRKNEKLGSRPFFENVEMRPGQAVTGTVRTQDGQPAAGVKVQASCRGRVGTAQGAAAAGGCRLPTSAIHRCGLEPFFLGMPQLVPRDRPFFGLSY